MRKRLGLRHCYRIFCLIMVGRRMHLIPSAMRSQAHRRSTAFQERCHLGNIMQLTLFGNNGGKSYFVFSTALFDNGWLFRRMFVSMIPKDTLYSLLVALAGWHAWVTIADTLYRATMLTRILVLYNTQPHSIQTNTSFMRHSLAIKSWSFSPST